MFPKHNILPPKGDNPIFNEMYQKKIDFHPLPFCEFFQGMDVLQIYGQETKEYIYALYFNSRLVGHVYHGDLYSEKQILQIKEQFFPPTWEEIQNYVNETSGVWYAKMHQSQYAFVFDRVLKKIE